MDLYGTGCAATACCTRRKNSLPRLRDVRRVEAERGLVQIVVQMLVADRPLVGTQEP